jgi:hypothetical protein
MQHLVRQFPSELARLVVFDNSSDKLADVGTFEHAQRFDKRRTRSDRWRCCSALGSRVTKAISLSMPTAGHHNPGRSEIAVVQAAVEVFLGWPHYEQPLRKG